MVDLAANTPALYCTHEKRNPRSSLLVIPSATRDLSSYVQFRPMII